MTQNVALFLEDFFSRNPDIRAARDKNLVNRRALARYIIKQGDLPQNKYESLVTALRRFPTGEAGTSGVGFLSDLKLSTKDHISIVYIRKTHDSLKRVAEFAKTVNVNENQTLKIVQGVVSLKLYVDTANLDDVKKIFHEKEIVDITKDVAELHVIFPEEAMQTKGVIAYVTSQLAINSVTIADMLTGAPELVIYVKEEDMLSAYETMERIRQGSG